jgi:hypothetical protein
MNRSRRRAYDERTGRVHHDQQPRDGAGAAAATYELLLPRLAQLRAALAADDRAGRPLEDVRRDHAALDSALAEAIAQSFAADALYSPTPVGITSWAAEGLARSRERELALIAATDASGAVSVTTAAAE